MAALKLAHSISKANLNFCLMETSNYLGGRIKTIKFEGLTVEEGANWIEGTVGKSGKVNPAWRLAQEVNLEFDPTTGDMVVFDQKGREVTKDYNNSKAELHTFLGDLSGKLK